MQAGYSAIWRAALVASCLSLHALPARAQEHIGPIPPVAPMMPQAAGLTLTPFVGRGFEGDDEGTFAALGAALGYGLDRRWRWKLTFTRHRRPAWP